MLSMGAAHYLTEHTVWVSHSLGLLRLGTRTLHFHADGMHVQATLCMPCHTVQLFRL